MRPMTKRPFFVITFAKYPVFKHFVDVGKNGELRNGGIKSEIHKPHKHFIVLEYISPLPNLMSFTEHRSYICFNTCLDKFLCFF